MMMRMRNRATKRRRAHLFQLGAVLLLAPLLFSGRDVCGTICMSPSADSVNEVRIERGAVHVKFRHTWNSMSVRTRSGKWLSLVQPVLYGLTHAPGKHIRWPDVAWPCLTWHALEQGEQRDVLYVEGRQAGWLVQAWLALYAEEEALYIRKRTTRIRRPAGMVNSWGTLGASYPAGEFGTEKMTVVIDDQRVGAKPGVGERFCVFRRSDRSVALVSPGEAFQHRGEGARHFFRCTNHPDTNYVECLLSQTSASLEPGSVLETCFALLWGDGDVTPRVKLLLAGATAFAARLPAPRLPPAITEPSAPAKPVGNLPSAIARASFSTPEGLRRRVWCTGPRLTAPPVLDGRLDDERWQGPWTGDFILQNTVDLAADIKTAFKVRFDDSALFVAVRCTQPRMADISVRKLTPRQWASGEKIEMFFQAGGHIFQFGVDPEGGLYDSRDGRADVDLEVTAAVRKAAEEWTYEIKIPFTELGMRCPDPFDTMAFNLVRNAVVPGSPMELSGWNAARGAFASAQNFGTLFFGTEEEYRTEQGYLLEALLDRDVYQTLHAGAGACVDIASSSSVPDTAELAVSILTTSGQALRASRAQVQGSRGGCVLDLSGLPPGQYEARFELVIEDQAVARTSKPFRIQAAARQTLAAGRVPISVSSQHDARVLPVSVGVPFPLGELRDAQSVRLIDASGDEVPVQVSTLARWDPAGSVSWLGLRFQAPEVSRSARPFVLEYGKPAGVRHPSPLRVIETEDQYLVHTGPLRFAVPADHGGVLDSVALDVDGDGSFGHAEVLVQPSAELGPYLVDGNGRWYRAALDRSAEVRMEESGPLRVVFRIASWYVSEDGVQLCRHVTRVSAFAGLPHLRLEHTWILTAATGEAVFKDIGFAVPIAENRETVFGTEHGPFGGYNRFPRSLLQLTERRYVIRGSYQRLFVSDAARRAPIRQDDLVEGVHAPGWMAVKGASAGMLLAVDEFWQNFPKELSLEGDTVTFHVWPKHGQPRARRLTERTAVKLDFVHSGETLDFTPPQELTEYEPVQPSERGFYVGAGRANAIGLAKTHRFALTFFPAGSAVSDLCSETLAVADTPCALAAPKWLTDSGAFGPMQPRGPERFSEVETALDLWSRVVPRLNHLGGFYGMWIYGQFHTTYNPNAERWDTYRIYNQLHHTGPRWPWIMWLRSGDTDLHDVALANTRSVADVGFCHFSRPEFEKLPWPYGKARGGLTDYKGLVPWHSGARNPDYNSMTAFLLWHSYLTGDAWTREVALTWGDLAKKQGPGGTHRTGAGTVAAVLDLYRATGDPALIPIYRKSADSLLKSQLADGSFPAWENYATWLGPYVRFTGNTDARSALVRWADAHLQGHGDLSEEWGNYMNLIAEAYFATGQRRYAQHARGLLESWCWSVNDNPDSHLRGAHGGRGGRSLSFLGFHLPRTVIALRAWADAGDDIVPLYPRTPYDSSETSEQRHRVEIRLLQDSDSPITFTVDGRFRERSPYREHPVQLTVTAPDGRRVMDKAITAIQRTWTAHGTTRAAPSRWFTESMPVPDSRGVFHVVLECADVAFTVWLPVSNRSEVVAVADGKIRLGDDAGMATVYLPKGLKRPVVGFTCHSNWPQTVRVRDPEFRVVETVHLFGMVPQAQRRSVSLRLPDDYEGGFWTVGGGRPHGVEIDFPGDWKPLHYAVWPQRTFRPER